MRLPAEEPNFKSRSILQIAQGLWQMRNGHTARVESLLQLPYGDGKKFPVWKGKCVECGEHRTWNINGTYAAHGKHPYDLMRPA